MAALDGGNECLRDARSTCEIDLSPAPATAERPEDPTHDDVVHGGSVTWNAYVRIICPWTTATTSR